MRVFPAGPISIGTLAALELLEVESAPDGKVARYRVNRKDALAFTAAFSGVGPQMKQRYEPVRGAVWAFLDVPDEADEIQLVVGVPRKYGVAMARARAEMLSPKMTSKQREAACVLPDSSIRAAMRGILDREGQR